MPPSIPSTRRVPNRRPCSESRRPPPWSIRVSVNCGVVTAHFSLPRHLTAGGAPPRYGSAPRSSSSSLFGSNLVGGVSRPRFHCGRPYCVGASSNASCHGVVVVGGASTNHHRNNGLAYGNSPMSRTIVTGPSLTSSTCIRPPNTPVSTWTPNSRSASQKRS
jgi:hypothetical protein